MKIKNNCLVLGCNTVSNWNCSEHPDKGFGAGRLIRKGEKRGVIGFQAFRKNCRTREVNEILIVSAVSFWNNR